MTDARPSFDFEDPFGPSADAARYVPRAATERALEELVAIVRDARGCALLSGEPGIGKTLMLRLLSQHLEPGLSCAQLPYASLPLAPLCAWALEVLGATPSYDPAGAVLTWARRAQAETRGLVLLLDDAEAMPEETAREVARLAQKSDGALCFVAAADRRAARELADALGGVQTVSLHEPMDDAETREYLRAYLTRARVPREGLDAFDAEALAGIYARARGIPSRVNAEASAVLRRRLLRPEPLAAPPPPAASPQAPPDPGLERAAGRLVLAHAEPEAGQPPRDAALERAMGRLALSELRDGEAEAPAPAHPAEGASVAGRRLAAAAGVFGVFFASGIGAGLWLARRGEAPQLTAPRPPAEAGLPAVGQAPPQATPARVAEAGPVAPPLAPVRVQINATPWATIRVDGQEVGVTPLAGLMLPPGAHRFEAHFPDGRVVARQVEIDGSNRFVVFP